MSDIYASLQVSPKKKRRPPEFDDGNTLTPKKLRNLQPTPPKSTRRSRFSDKQLDLPPHLCRLYTIHSALQHALSHALATCAVSPTSSTGVIRNVLNHLSLDTYTGLSTQFEADDLCRLCWLWEWDGKSVPHGDKEPEEEDENPFLTKDLPLSAPTDWTRGAMGLVVSSATHYSRTDRKRVPAYGIGIEVEIDIDKDMEGGMASVARWTAASESRRADFRAKLESWVKLHHGSSAIPLIPKAELPRLSLSTKVSALTRTLASASPKGTAALASLSHSLPGPSSPSRLILKSPAKCSTFNSAVPPFKIPSSNSPSKNTVLFPKTPSRRADAADITASITTSPMKEPAFTPSTPVHQKGSNAITVPQTPTSSRRQALYERVRQRSMTATPQKATDSGKKGGKLTKDQIAKMAQDELRRRCLLGRLGGVAESVWMLFITPVNGSSVSLTSRKRRALPKSEVTTAVVKSSPIPISSADAEESLSMLTKLCPFFIKDIDIGGEEWLETPASHGALNIESAENSPVKKTPASPSTPRKLTSSELLVSRSPKRVEPVAGGLRTVREFIRKELELQD